MGMDENKITLKSCNLIGSVVKNTSVPPLSVPQMASYFGYSVAVTDLNGDG